MRKRLCIIGLEETLANEIKNTHFGPVIYHGMLPKFLVYNGTLYIERSKGVGMLPVDTVVFHGIFEEDFDFLTALTLWGGRCFPNPLGMLNCRLKLPCLARAMQISRFNTPRGIMPPKANIDTSTETVAKWGNWHCGENKTRFTGEWQSEEATILEPFFDGQSVRVVSVGDVNYQINLEGDDWLKSIHHADAAFMDMDAELLDDTLNLKKAFGLEMIANDYIVGDDGRKHLLEVNHIPNMTRFDKLSKAYVETVKAWLK